MADNDKSNNSVKIGITAGVIGAAAGAASVYLSDKNNRKKVANRLEQVKKWSDRTVAEWKAKTEEATDKSVKKADNVKQEVTEKTETALDDEDEENKKILHSSTQVN